MALWTYPNGLRVNIYDIPELNTASLCIDLLGGYQGETQLLNGTCEMISRLLLAGTTNHPTAHSLEEYAKSRGLVVKIETKTEYMEICIDCLKTSINSAIDFAYEIIFESNFSEENIELLKSQMKSEVELLKLQPNAYLTQLTNQTMFARTGLMNTRIGNVKSIDRITKEVIMAQVEKYRTPKNMVIAVGGEIEEDKVFNKVGNVFYNALADMSYRQIKYVSQITNFDGFINIKNRPYNQSRIEMSFFSVPFKDNQKFTLDVVSRCLETELKQRLADEGYFKSLELSNVYFANNGKFVVKIIVDGDNAEHFLERVMMELKQIVLSKGIDEDAFVAEKNAFITEYVLASESSRELTRRSAEELMLTKREFDLNDKFEILKEINLKDAFKLLRTIINFEKVNIAYLGTPIGLDFLKKFLNV